MSSREVLPAPDGPKRTVTPREISKSTVRVKRSSGRTTFLRARVTSGFRAADEPFASPHRQEGQPGGDADQTKRDGVLAELDILVDGQGQSGGLPGNVAGHHDGRAKLPQSTR